MPERAAPRGISRFGAFTSGCPCRCGLHPRATGQASQDACVRCRPRGRDARTFSFSVLDRGRSMRVERVPFRLISAATAAVLLAACGQKQSAPPPQTPEVGVVTRPADNRAGRHRTAWPHQRLPRRASARAGRRHRAAPRVHGRQPGQGRSASVQDRPGAVHRHVEQREGNAREGAGEPRVGHRAGQPLQGAGRRERGQQAGLRQRGRLARPGRRRRRSGQGRRRYRADQSRLYRRDLAGHRPDRRVASHAGRLRAGERGNAAGDRPATRSGLRRPDAIEPRRSEAAPRSAGRASEDDRSRRGQGHR